MGRQADAAAARPSYPANEYVRHGPCTLWLFVDPLGQWRTANAIPSTRAWTGRARCRPSPDHPRYRQAERLILVCDHWNIHTYASFYRAFPPAEARRLAWRVQLVFTPRHGSWLHRAEPELSVLTRQALSPCMPTQAAVHAWAQARNAAQTGIRWQFRTVDARVRLKHLYTTIET